MRFYSFTIKKGKVNFKIPLKLAPHVDSDTASYNLGQNKRQIKTIPDPSY